MIASPKCLVSALREWVDSNVRYGYFTASEWSNDFMAHSRTHRLLQPYCTYSQGATQQATIPDSHGGFGALCPHRPLRKPYDYDVQTLEGRGYAGSHRCYACKLPALLTLVWTLDKVE